MRNEIQTLHKLDFFAADWPLNPLVTDEGKEIWMVSFKVGTVNGLYHSDKKHFYIFSLINKEPGNGHLEDVFQWFEHSCRKMNRTLIVEEIINIRFLFHLINKRGFRPIGVDSVEKVFV